MNVEESALLLTQKTCLFSAFLHAPQILISAHLVNIKTITINMSGHEELIMNIRMNLFPVSTAGIYKKEKPHETNKNTLA
jgi:hypothetical protein